MKTAPLLHQGKPMTSALRVRFGTYPTGTAADVIPSVVLQSTETVYGLLRRGEVVQGYLEPGDGTRYDLVLTPVGEGAPHAPQPGLIVSRMVGGRVLGCAVLWDWTSEPNEFQIEEAAAKLCNGNEWSMKLLAWWITELLAF